MKVLVTGGSGFIGSHITDKLIEEGYKVIVVDKTLKNTNPKAKYYETSITDKESLKKIFSKEQPEIVNHHAAQISVPASMTNPLNDAETNVCGTINLLKLSLDYGVKNFVYASTCAVYGTPETRTVDENHRLKPESPYGASKLACEYYIPIFMQNYAILRYANVYGPRQRTKGEGAVIPTFIKNMKQDKTIIIHGDGNQVRDLIYVDDIAEINIKAMELRTRTTLNVGTEKATSVNQLFRKIKEITGYARKPEYAGERPGDIRRMVLQNAKMAKQINYHPKTSLDKGLEETINVY